MSHLRHLSFSLLVLAAACGGRSNGAQPTTPPSPQTADTTSESISAPTETEVDTSIAGTASAACPTELADANLRIEEHERGASVVLTATDTPEDLRARAVAFAATHNREHSRMGALPESSHSATDRGSETGTGEAVGNSVSRGPDVEGQTEGRTGIETPTEEVGDDTSIAEGGMDDEGQVLAGGTGTARSLPMTVQTHSRARVEYNDQGVKIVFDAADEDVEALRSELMAMEESCRGGQ